MSVSAPCPPDHPLMIAWNAYKATEEYPNTKKWAVYTEHVEGSLWAAFMAGFNAQSVAISDSPNIARWIPMTERAPEDGADVIVFDDDKPFRWVGECRHCLTRGEHFFYGGGEGDCHYRVTHWMPMPEPPK